MKYVNDIDVRDKLVFVRADLNVPINEQGEVADDTRIRAALNTVGLILEKDGKVVLSSHLGRPKGKRVDSMSLAPVRKRIGELLNVPVDMCNDCIGPEVKEKAQALKPGEVLLLENLRFHAEEEANDPGFSKALSELAEVYVNDAFATAHRAHASTVGMTEFVQEKAGGLTIKNELEYFAQAFDNPARPFVAIFGGVKISTKMNAIRHVGQYADKILIGGAMANTFFVANGMNVGKSLYESEEVENARSIRTELSKSGCELLLPVDVIVAKELKTGVQTKAVAINAIEPDWMALDIGPESLERFNAALSDAGTIVWNGPMGAFETNEFSSGTFGIVDALSNSSALTVVGGGDTDSALHQRNAFDRMGYVSTAGGAFLKLLEGKTLPAVAALES